MYAWPKFLVTLVAGLLAIVTSVAHAQQGPRALKVNLDYRLISQQPVATGERIEVIDFFWYGCPTCNAVQPALEAWLKQKPADVVLRRVPAILREPWTPHARIYYTLESLGETDRLHQAVYHGYHVEQLHMSKPEVMEQWAVQHGIPRDRWTAAYRSAVTDEKVEAAKMLTGRYDVKGTPSFVVDGRYLTSASMAYSIEDLIFILDGLITKARADRAAKPQ